MSSYQNIRNKTIKWCKSLKDNDIYNERQYNECVAGFIDMSVGELPTDIEEPKTNNEYSYSL